MKYFSGFVVSNANPGRGYCGEEKALAMKEVNCLLNFIYFGLTKVYSLFIKLVKLIFK